MVLQLIKTEEVEYDLVVDGFLRLEYDDCVCYASNGSIDSFTVLKKTGEVTIQSFGGNVYQGFKNTYDDIIDQLNFCGCEFEEDEKKDGCACDGCCHTDK